MNAFKTCEVAKIMGVHVNTVRLYEKCRLIPKTERKSNGYRIFTDLHIEQFRLARAALKVEVLQNGLRKQAVNIIKISALGDFDEAKQMAYNYLQQIELETCHAKEAIEIAQQLLSGSNVVSSKVPLRFTRREAAEYLQITVDTLRNWELNGLVTIKRRQNRCLVYCDEDIKQLKVVRSLRCANYSLSAILRMIGALSSNPKIDLSDVLDTPKSDENIITACDKLLTSLADAKRNMQYVIAQIEKMEQMKK